MSRTRAARRAEARRQRKQPRSWLRRRGWIVGTTALFALLAAVLLWPRDAAYADYVDGRRPSVVFVWSDPTPHHPDG